MAFSGYSRGGPNSGFGGSPAGPSNAYLPPNGQFASQRPTDAFSGPGPVRSGGFGGPSLSTPSSFGGLSGGFGGSSRGSSNAYLPPRRDFGPQSTEFGNQKPSSPEPTNIYGAPEFVGPSAGLGSFEGFPSGSGNVPVSGGGRYGQGPSGTYGSSAFERNVFGEKGPSGKYDAPDSGGSGFSGQRSSGGSPSGIHDAPTSGSSRFGGHRPSGGRPSGTYGAPTSRGSAFGGQGSSGKGPSGTYDIPASEGSGFGGQGPYGEKVFGGRPLGAYGAPSSSHGGSEDPSKGGFRGPSNIYLPTAEGVGRPSQLSGGVGTQISRKPFGFHDVPGLGGGYNGSPNGPSNTYLPPTSGGGLGGQGPSRNSGFSGQGGSGSGQFSGTFSSTNTDGSSKGLGGFPGGNGSGFGGQRPSGSYAATAAGGPSGVLGTHTGTGGGFDGPSNAYLPPSSSFNDQGPSGSGIFGGPKPGGGGFGSGSGSYGAPSALSDTGFSASLDSPFSSCDTPGSGSPSNEDIGFRGSSSGPSNTYLAPQSGGSSVPREFGHLSGQYGVPDRGGGGSDQRFQDGNNSSHGLQRNSSGRPSKSYGTPSQGSGSGRSSDIYSVPSQGQKYNSAFEGYKY